MKFSELLAKLGVDTKAPGVFLDCGDPEISGVANLKEAASHDLGFMESSRFFAQLAETKAGALLLNEDPEVIDLVKSRGIPYIALPQPRLLFAQAIALFYQPTHPQPGIHPSAAIAKDVRLGKDVYIGPHVAISSGSQIGDGAVIYPNVTIYDGVTIGDRTILHANCVIHERSAIGNDCTIHSGAVIGAEGFGFVPSPDGTWVKMHQAGRTVLEDGVEVGCNAAIDRGSVGDTRIGRGTKIDNLVQIGHGCRTGENCILAGQAGMAGGAELGKNVILAGQVGVANHVKIGDRVVAAAQSGIPQDIAADSQVIGAPAIPVKTFMRASALFRRLPEIYKTIKEIQKKLGDNEQ
ncbi:MAG: UDP-3-O-(3-hydroxymyristoyl)glucosamine N-acyltransferase [Pseudanabaena sp. CRU_2_10]|nr:UDP-3-O-(3-hydroxymyristoyl)glucosamine N-acyltransferase [Pseudanabaena sp. CRU_2_10]